MKRWRVAFIAMVGLNLTSVPGDSVLAEATKAPAAVISPEVHADHSITFRIRAPGAHSLLFKLEGQNTTTNMDKDAEGVWSITTAPLTPDYYGYSFFMDDVMLIDPSSPQIKPSLITAQSEAYVVGPEPAPWDITDVAHGEVHHHFYHSAITNDDRDYYVYTPPGYNSGSKRTYPVLYLLHGFSDGANAWTAIGRANVVLDNLIAQHKAKPMIVVMPLGYGDMDIVRHGWEPQSDELRERNIAGFRKALSTEIMPRVEHQYKINGQRTSHAIAGVSMGGAQSLLNGLNNLDKFAWVGAFSSGIIPGDFDHAFPMLDSSANQRLKLLWIACGIEDNFITHNRDLRTWLQAKDVHLTAIETPGGHTWLVWRRNLIEFLPLLFQPSAALKH